MTEIAENLDRIRRHLPRQATLIAVSKTFDANAVREAYHAGQRNFGENKVQELLSKAQEVQDLPDIRWHFIGHLQSNKVKDLLRVPHLATVQSVDRLKVAQLLNERLEREGRELDVLIQVNTSSEESKYGCTPKEAPRLICEIAALPQLHIKGLMTIGKLGGSADEIRKCFRVLRTIAAQVEVEALPGVSMQTLSMGMTSDYEAALKEGSNMVRIGQAIFGKRHLPDQYYWPEKGQGGVTQ